VKMLLL